jgi:arsenite methyltransferase
MKSVKRNGRYGIDAPYVPALMITGAVICIGLIVFAHMFQLWITVVILLVLAGVYLPGMAYPLGQCGHQRR